MKKSIGIVLAFVLFVPIMFLTGCDLWNNSSELETRIEQLEEEKGLLEDKIVGMTKVFYLELEEEVSATVCKDSEIIVFISYDSGYMCFAKPEGVSGFALNLEKWNETEFVSYESVSGNGYVTPGSGIYKITVSSITGATSMQLKILLTETEQ